MDKEQFSPETEGEKIEEAAEVSAPEPKKEKRSFCPFKGLNKKEKVIKAVNYIFSGVMAVVCLAYFIYLLASGNDPNNRLLVSLGVAGLFVLPMLLEVVFRLRLSGFIFIFYNVYVFFAAFLGAVIYVYGMFEYYDKIIHLLFGYVGGIVGLLLLCKLGNYDHYSAVFVCVMCYFISMGLGASWEIFEFFGDNFLNQTSQGFPVQTATGEWVTTVTDTMLDIIANFIGAIIFIVHYIIHRNTKKNLLLGYIIKDFNTAGSRGQVAGIDCEKK